LDDFLGERHIVASQIDVIKMDVEGGELEVLRSAPKLLTASERPLIMCEVEDIRTKPWGYLAIDIYDHLAALGFSWFIISAPGKLVPLERSQFKQGNLIAVPKEKLQSIARFR
jgi:hypothetical protein